MALFLWSFRRLPGPIRVRYGGSGPDLRSAWHSASEGVVYGLLPYAQFEQIRRKFIAAIRTRRSGVVPRIEQDKEQNGLLTPTHRSKYWVRAAMPVETHMRSEEHRDGCALAVL